MNKENLNTSGFTSFSGKVIDNEHIRRRAQYSKAIYNGLFGYTSPHRVKKYEIENKYIYNKLATKNYTGDNALTEYLLDYYNNNAEFNMAGKTANSLDELSIEAIFDICKGPNYVPDPGAQGDTEIEKQLAELFYNYYYDNCLGLAFNRVITNDDFNNGTNRVYETSSIQKLYDNTNGIKDSADEYLNSLFEKVEAKSQGNADSSSYNVTIGVDGPNTKNVYASHPYFIKSTFDLVNYRSVYSQNYEVQVNYLEDGTNKVLAEQYFNNKDYFCLPTDAYDLTELTDKDIAGYTFTRMNGNDVIGTFEQAVDGRIIINIYYLKNSVPTKPDNTATNKDNTVDTSDNTNVAVLISMLSLAGIALGYTLKRQLNK